MTRTRYESSHQAAPAYCAVFRYTIEQNYMLRPHDYTNIRLYDGNIEPKMVTTTNLA